MKTLHLLRHAKSAWDDSDLPDEKRPLNGRGKRDSRALCKHLQRHPIRVDAVFCSNAVRARKTLAAIEPALGKARLVDAAELYGAGVEELTDFIRGLDAKLDSVMLIGHNPGFEELTTRLLPAGKAPAAFPTCTLASLDFEVAGWDALRPGRGRLERFLTPADFA